MAFRRAELGRGLLATYIVDFSRLVPAVEGPRVEFRLDVHRPWMFGSAAERMRASQGVAGLPYAAQALRSEAIEWSMIATTGQVILWSTTHVLAYGSIAGVPIEHQFMVSRVPPQGEMAQFWVGHDEWFDFYLDSQAHRLRAPDKRRGGAALPSSEVCRVTWDAISPWLDHEPVEWMGMSSMGSILLHTASRVAHTWCHVHVERLVVLPRFPPT
jgi:hypothetical protein